MTDNTQTQTNEPDLSQVEVAELGVARAGAAYITGVRELLLRHGVTLTDEQMETEIEKECQVAVSAALVAGALMAAEHLRDCQKEVLSNPLILLSDLTDPANGRVLRKAYEMDRHRLKEFTLSLLTVSQEKLSAYLEEHHLDKTGRRIPEGA